MKIAPCFAILTAFLIFQGCTTGPKIGSTANPDKSFAEYETFAILPIPAQAEGGSPGGMLRLKPTLESALRQAFTGIGLTEAPLEAADLAVNVKGAVVPKTDIIEWGYTGYPYFGYSGRMGWLGVYPYSDTTVDQYDEGTLAVELYERASKEMIWVGWATDRLSSRATDPEVIRSAISEIVANFPAQ